MSKPNVYIKKRKEHLLPELNEWPINILNNRREAFIEKVVKETLSIFIDGDQNIIEELHLAHSLEERRIKNDPWSVDPPNEKAFWNSIHKSVRAIDQLPEDNEQRVQLAEEALRRIITVYAEEIAGRFKPSIFRLARKFCNRLFSILFNRFWTGKFGFWGNSKHLPDKIRVLGPVNKVRKLFEKGTVVFVPTHSSNLDSLLVGYALDSFVGFPSAHYGAGLNLYNSEIAGYFMNRMGAYRVDRRKKNSIYLETLKSTSRVAIRLGVNSLFFPGGTRSRSGEIEQNLKLGLLGTAVEAQRMLIQEKSDKGVYIVPLVISYSNVLEDSSMYRNFLQRQGYSGFVKKRFKQKNTFLKMTRLIGQLFRQEMLNYITVGEPLDVMGNQVDEHGESVDKQGNRVLMAEYFLKNGEVTQDEQREMQYTRHLASLVADAYRESNVVRIGQLCSAAFLQVLWSEQKINSVEATLKLSSSEWNVPIGLFLDKFDAMINQFRSMSAEGQCRLEDLILQEPSNELLIEEGLKQLRTYQIYNVLSIQPESASTDHIGLIMYYANRLECYFMYQSQL